MFEEFLTQNLPILLKLVVATFLGAVIGVERTLANKVAGMRTYAFVSLGSALLVIISSLVTSQFSAITAFDPLRVTAAIVMGVGFLCGGIIVYHDNKFLGVTTAAGLWVATAIGIAVGFGFYTIAATATVLTLFIFSTLWGVEERFRKDEILK